MLTERQCRHTDWLAFSWGAFAGTLAGRIYSESEYICKASMFSNNSSKHARAAETTSGLVQHYLLHMIYTDMSAGRLSQAIFLANSKS